MSRRIPSAVRLATELEEGDRGRDAAERPIEIDRVEVVVVNGNEHDLDPLRSRVIEEGVDQSPADSAALVGG
jgi:hypothetical protein